MKLPELTSAKLVVLVRDLDRKEYVFCLLDGLVSEDSDEVVQQVVGQVLRVIRVNPVAAAEVPLLHVGGSIRRASPSICGRAWSDGNVVCVLNPSNGGLEVFANEVSD